MYIDPEYQAMRFQFDMEAGDSPEMSKARKLRQAMCPHDKVFPLGLCARCGKMTILVAQAVMGLSIMPDKYRRLIGINGDVSQVGCSAIEWEDLFAELDRSDMPDWEKDNVIDYKISTMMSDWGYDD
jgi:hypothetical protein